MKKLEPQSVVLIVMLAFVYVGYVLYPLGSTLIESLRVESTFSVANYLELLSRPSNVEAIGNSIWVSLLSVVLSGAVGILFAFVFAYIEFPFRTTLSRLAILPIAMPPLVGVISFLFVFGESGILSRMVNSFFGSSVLWLDGMNAIVAVHAYSFYVYFYLFVSTALRSVDSSQLEAALSLGSSPLYTVRRVIMPALKPAMLAASILTFMASMASFSAPLIFGGEKRFMTLQIYNAKLNGELNVAAAEAFGLTLVSILFFIVLKFVSPDAPPVSTKGVVRIGILQMSRPLKLVATVACMILLIVVALPILMIVIISFAQEGSWTWQLLPTAYTVENYAKLLSEPSIFEPIKSSILMSLIAVAGCIIIGVSVAYVATKGALRRWRFVVDIVATLPYAVPGTVVAIGLILAFNSPTIFSLQRVLVGTFWILPLAYFVRLFPLVVRSTTASLAQLDDSLIEAAETLGAGGWRRFRKIVLPIILPGVISGALLVVIIALGEFVSSILLYTYSNRPIAVEILARMRSYNFGAAAAYSVLLLVLIMMISSVANFFTKKRPTDVML